MRNTRHVRGWWFSCFLSVLLVTGIAPVFVIDGAAQQPSPGRPFHDQARKLAQQGQLGQAMAQYREAIRRDPNILESRNDLAWIMATSDDPNVRNPKEAVATAEQLVDDVIRFYALRRQLAGGATPGPNPYAGLPNPPHFYKVTVIRTLAAAYAANGNFQPENFDASSKPSSTAKALAAAAGCAAPSAVPYAQLANQAAVAESRKRPNPEVRALVSRTAEDVKEYRAGTAKRLQRPIE